MLRNQPFSFTSHYANIIHHLPTTSLDFNTTTTTTTQQPCNYDPPSTHSPITFPPNDPSDMTPNTLKSFQQSLLQNLGEDGIIDSDFNILMGSFVPPLPSSSTNFVSPYAPPSTNSFLYEEGQMFGEAASNIGSQPYTTNVHVTEQEVAERSSKKKKSSATTPNKPIPSLIRLSRKPSQEEGRQQQQQQQQQPSSKRRRRQQQYSPDEEQQLIIRREKNRLAAARCRQKKVDLTNRLINETEDLQTLKLSYENEILRLSEQKKNLEGVLQSHNCVKIDIKPFA